MALIDLFCVYPYGYMGEWEKFNETSLPEKEELYSNLNMEDITDADYMHAKRVCKDFEMKSLGEYHDLYLKSDTLLLADVFENLENVFKILSSRSCKISFGPWIWAKLELELLTDIDMLLMVEIGKGEKCDSINKYLKDYDKNKEW